MKRNSDAMVLSYNRKAMDYLRNEDYQNSFFYLTKAEELLNTDKIESVNKLYGITLNNFGCFYKRTGNPALALNFLRKALEVESRPPVDINNLAGTYLNVCAMYSQMNDHQKALAHALKAVSLLDETYLEGPEMLMTLVVAHFNAGIEYELLSRMPSAFSIYQKGYFLARDNLGEDHPLTENLRKNMKETMNSRRNISATPIKKTAANFNGKSRGSVPRSYRNSYGGEAEQENPFKSAIGNFLRDKNDKIRFITGDRLKPMFKKEEELVRKSANKRRVTKELMNELNGVSSRESDKLSRTSKRLYTTEKQASSNFGEKKSDARLKTSTGLPSRASCDREKNNIAVQVDFCDRTLMKNIRVNAAIVIQKYFRMFLAKKKYEIKKYSNKLKEAEKQAKAARDKLIGLGKKINYPPPINTELIPIAYKDKLDSPVKTLPKIDNPIKKFSKSLTLNYRKMSTLKPIPEEVSVTIDKSKIIIIQKFVRGWLQRKKYLKIKRSSVVIQKNVRKFQTRKLFKQILEAIVFIQRLWRLKLKTIKSNIIKTSKKKVINKK